MCNKQEASKGVAQLYYVVFIIVRIMHWTDSTAMYIHIRFTNANNFETISWIILFQKL